MRIATWNVNSVRRRLDHVVRFVEQWQPDVLCLQEIKVSTESFPGLDLAQLGFTHQVVNGQKGYNGVAILSRLPFEDDETRQWCGKDDARHAAVRLKDSLMIHNFYVPAGGDTPDPEANEKFAHKLDFLAEMQDWARNENLAGQKAVIVGDLNVAPLENDVWNHKRLKRSVGHTPLECEQMLAFWQAGQLTDLGRRFFPEPEPLYSWWGYRYAQAFAKNYGWRLDHVLTTPPLAEAVKALSYARETRSWDQPSDHIPVVLDLA